MAPSVRLGFRQKFRPVSRPKEERHISDTDPDTGVREGDQFGKKGPGEDHHDYEHTTAGDKQTEGGPGTAGSVPEGNRHTGGQE